MCAVLAFSFGLAVHPGSDGSLGVSIADAKGKGGKAGKHAEVREKRGRGPGTKEHKGQGYAATDRRDRYDSTRRTDRGDRRDERRRRYGDATDSDRDWRERRRHAERDEGATGDAYEDSYEARSWGATASQLKHRNAANASESAFQNASPNSNVGRISTYRDAARETLEKESDIEALDLEIEDLRVRRQLAQNDGYYDDADALDARIIELERERRLAQGDLYDLRIAEQEAYDAVGGPELDAHDYNIFRSMLGLE